MSARRARDAARGGTETRATACPLDCPDACGVLAEVDAAGALVALRGNPDHPWSRGTLCGKTARFAELAASPERLLHPLVREGGRKGAPLVPASWDEALERIAERLGPLAGEDVLALQYGGTMGLVQRRYPLRVTRALGAVEHDDGICDATAGAGWKVVLGRMVGPNVAEVAAADAVVVWGADPARTVPHLMPRLKELCERGVPVVCVDVYRTDTIEKLERWGGRGLLLRPGTDAALALALTREAFARGLADRAFLAAECVGAAEYEAHVAAGPTLAEAAAICGVAEPDALSLLEVLARAQKPFVKLGIGWTRRRNGAMGMRAVCSLAAVLGHARRAHCESGDAFALAAEVVDRPDLHPAVRAGAAEPPTTVQIRLGETLSAGRFRAALVWCHNPALTLPDSARVRAGLAREDLFVVVHDLFVTETAELADVVLPATTFLEHTDLYKSYGHRVLQLGRRAVTPPPGPRSNVETFAALARRLGLAREVWDVTAEGLADELLAASRGRFAPGQLEAVRAGEPVELAPPPFDGWGTPSGRVELYSAAEAALGRPPMASWVPDDGAGETGGLWLHCTPSKHVHNSTFLHSPGHRRRHGEPRCWLHPADAAQHGLAAGDRARLSNGRGALTLPVGLDPASPRGLARVDGIPTRRSLPEGLSINALVPPASSDLVHGSVLYSTRVDVARAPEGAAAEPRAAAAR